MSLHNKDSKFAAIHFLSGTFNKSQKSTASAISFLFNDPVFSQLVCICHVDLRYSQVTLAAFFE
ncbi:MAG: hypothetical protein SFV17_16845 [Candidatus Obscuribacter sp.]|nr:hypothetical protein [Candidatus Obscuribacter sp.]